MLWADLLDILLARCQRLKLWSEGATQPDSADIEMALLDVELTISGRTPIDAHTVENLAMFATQTGIDTYALPSDFGRLLPPARDRESGLWIWDGTMQWPLEVWDFKKFREYQETDNARPTACTVKGRTIRLTPPPDSNDDAHYTGRGVYIQQVAVRDIDDDLDVTHADALRDGVLCQLAEDYNHAQQQVLRANWERSQNRLLVEQGLRTLPLQRRLAYRYHSGSRGRRY